MMPPAGARRAPLRWARAFPIPFAAFFFTFAFDAAAQPGPADGIWSRFDFPSDLSTREYHGMVYDPVRGRMLVIGGHPQFLNDVWALPLGGIPAWHQVYPGGTPPSPRFAHSVIYQPGRDRVILFGGFDGSFRNDVWALSLSGTPSWTPVTAAGTPPAGRWAHVAIYDPAGERMIVFGGYDGSAARNDVWELSLGAAPAWTRLDPAGRTPAARTNLDGAYDAAGNRLIVFGGFDTATQRFFGDTWALSLSRNPVWVELHPGGTPPAPRRDHSAVYDAARRRLVVFGGFDLGLQDRSYALTLGAAPSWSEIGVAGSRPSARKGHRAIYDAANDRMLVCGGYDGQWLSDVWSLPLTEGSAWSQLPMPGAFLPAPRRNFGMAYAERSIVLFGGDGNPVLNDVAQLTLGDVPAWAPLSAAGSPTPRAGHHVIFDAPRHRVVSFGGVDGTFLADVNAFSLLTGSWASLDALGPGPSPRTYYGMVYDPVRERMLVIGGHPEMLNDVWSLPLNAPPVWQQILPAGTKPSPRFAHTAVYQPARDRVILFGGYDGSFRNDVWALSLSGTPAWSAITPAGTPPPGRWAPAAAYDPVRDRMIVFGGYDGTASRNDVWALSLGATPTWTQLSPGGPLPAARANVEGVYDPAGNRLIVFGGFNTSTQQFFNDTWTLSWQAAAPKLATRLEARATPGRPRLALAGAWPNPAARELTVAFSLEDESPASIELLDVAGRRVFGREVGSLGAGDHELRIDEAGRMPPGLYFLRLRQHQSARTARVLIAR